MMPSIPQLLIILLIILVLFGRGKLSGLAEDLGKSIKAFKKGMSEDEVAEGVEAEKKKIASEDKKAGKK